jgi:GlpG protein
MRQIGTLTEASQAQTLADYLLTLRIKTWLDQQPEGWVVWVCDEDQVPRARQELGAFLHSPADPRYTVAHRTAITLRQDEDRQEEEYRKRQENLRDKITNPGRFGRKVTTTLICISVLVALITNFGEAHDVERLFTITTFPTEANVVAMSLPQQLATGEVWRLFTPIFLHYGLEHLVFNMLMLAAFGSQIELSRGPWKFLAMVLVIAVLSNLGQYYLGNLSLKAGAGWVFHPNPRFGGMSGVVYGLFGYIWMKTRFDPELGLYVNPTTVMLLIGWFFLCMTGLVGHVANVCHGVGLVVGMAIGIAPYLGRMVR